MYASHHTKRRPSIFVATKAATAIPVAHELVREALIQAALDPAVRAIEFTPTAAAYYGKVPLDAIILCGVDSRQVLDIVELRPLHNVDDHGMSPSDRLGLSAHTRTAADILQDPLATNCRLVWACRHYRVSAGDRVRVLQVLSEEGSMTLAHAAAQCRFAVDAVAAVLAMACADLIEADLATLPLGPETRVRRRSSEGETHGH